MARAANGAQKPPTRTPAVSHLWVATGRRGRRPRGGAEERRTPSTRVLRATPGPPRARGRRIPRATIR
eukprot:11166981-Lingulodinium_polyedra.AAC.1